MSGFVHLIGAGPGDPGLLTLKARRVLEQAEVVVHDRLVGDEILNMANPEAEFIYVGKVSGRHALSQDEINALLVQKALEGKKVARLKGGDPFLYGRGGEEALFIREHGLDYEVIPGVTSAIAVPAYAGIPVTHRDATSSFAVITGHEKPDKTISSIHWDKIATGIGTLVFLMGVENLPYISKELIANGKDPQTPVALIRWGTLPQQAVLTGVLADIVDRVREADFKPPAVIVVGDVVRLREQLQWVENQPLWGKRIVVTRARAQASQLVEKIRAMGGQVVECPSIVIERESDLHALHNAFQNLSSYDWIIFTSVNGVDIFLDEMRRCQLDIRDLQGIRLAAIGPATRERIEAYGMRVDVVPDEYKAEGMLTSLKGLIQPGQWVLLPRARGARPVLPDSLRARGIHVAEVILYHAANAQRPGVQLVQELIDQQFDYVTFTSSSTVTNFVTMVGEANVSRINRCAKIACIGPITADTARGAGFSVAITASAYTIDGLLNAIVNDVKQQESRGVR